MTPRPTPTPTDALFAQLHQHPKFERLKKFLLGVLKRKWHIEGRSATWLVLSALGEPATIEHLQELLRTENYPFAYLVAYRRLIDRMRLETGRSKKNGAHRVSYGDVERLDVPGCSIGENHDEDPLLQIVDQQIVALVHEALSSFGKLGQKQFEQAHLIMELSIRQRRARDVAAELDISYGALRVRLCTARKAFHTYVHEIKPDLWDLLEGP